MSDDLNEGIRILGDVLLQRTEEAAELADELERVRAELADEREHRTNLEAAIEEHRRLILERVPVKSGRQIDEALWWWVQ